MIISQKTMRWAENVESIGARRGTCRILAGKAERKRPLLISESRLKDNIKADFQEMT